MFKCSQSKKELKTWKDNMLIHWLHWWLEHHNIIKTIIQINKAYVKLTSKSHYQIAIMLWAHHHALFTINHLTGDTLNIAEDILLARNWFGYNASRHINFEMLSEMLCSIMLCWACVVLLCFVLVKLNISLCQLNFGLSVVRC